MNIEIIDKWLDEEYGVSYTKLEELHDFYFEKYTDQKEEIEELKKEIERLNKECDTYMEVATRKARRIREAIEYIKEHSTTIDYKTMRADYNLNMNDLLDILKGGNK